MKPLFKLAILSTAFFGALQSSAYATASADASAFYTVFYLYYAEPAPDGSLNRIFQDNLPDGVMLSCNGILQSTNICGDSEALSFSNASSVEETISLIVPTQIALHNSSGTEFPGTFVFETLFSAFPHDAAGGAHVDNLLAEYAIATSQVYGDGVGDFHSCDTRDPGAYHPTPNSCGVFSPDSSEGELDLGPLGPDETLYANYAIAFELTAKGAPEPVSASLLIGGLAWLVFLSRQKQRTQEA